MATQDRATLAVGDQLAEACGLAVDDRARGFVETHHRDDHIVCFAGLRLGQADLGIFRLSEAADGAHLVAERFGHAARSIGGRDKPVLRRLRNQHQSPGDVTGSEHVRCRGS